MRAKYRDILPTIRLTFPQANHGGEKVFMLLKLYMTESRVGEVGRELDTGVCGVC